MISRKKTFNGKEIALYFHEKLGIGRQLNLPTSMISEGLTDGLPINLRQLLTISPPSNPTEWIVTATKLLKIQNSEQNKIENHSNCRTPILNVPRENNQNWKPRHFRPNKFAQSQVPNQTPRTLNSPKMHFQSQLRVEPQRIILKSDLPVHLRPYRSSPIQEKEIKSQVEKLLQAGLIKESNSPYSAPVTLAFKRDEGKKTRLCIDFRKLNALCKVDSEPLPIMDSLLDKLARAKFFSTLDLASGYWHVPYHSKDTEKLIFCTNFGLYEWCRLPFGIKVAPAIFNRLIRRILAKYKIDFA
ncbi:retrovirus-related Pol polyprotein from transposon 17.6 [Trichonephila clavipes]|nr:retrovirus-related Pol polyprotein from transposon 17.6 [Trichonephila clavipes]